MCRYEEKGFTVKEFFGSLLGIAVAIVVAAALVFGLMFAYWHFIAPQNATGQYNTNRNSQQWQAAKIAHERDQVTAYDESNDSGQKKAIAADFCTEYSDMTVVPSDLAQQQSLLCN